MKTYATDTMAIVSYLGKRRLPPLVKQTFLSADVGLCRIVVPAIVAVEVAYLSEKSRIEVSLDDLKDHISKYEAYELVPLSLEMIETSFQIDDIPELHDRLISGTARYLNFQLIFE